MATKLKNMRLTSVDLVRAGANQEADICLFKSATPPEATESPTEPETNIFKRFIKWLKENPTEAHTEPHSPVEKADEPADLETIYKTALIESIQSIYSDDSLTDIEKASMVEESIEQFQKKNRELFFDDDPDDPDDHDDHDDHDDSDDVLEEEDRFDEIEEVHKFNPYHASDGKFTTGTGGGGMAAPAGVKWHTTGGAATGTGGGRQDGKVGRYVGGAGEPKEKVVYTQEKKPKKEESKWDRTGDPYAGMKFTSPSLEREDRYRDRTIGGNGDKTQSELWRKWSK